MTTPKYKYDPFVEEVVDYLCSKTRLTSRRFFRNIILYYLAQVASHQHVKVLTQERGAIPVNAYVLNLASSGAGKGMSKRILEKEIFNQFLSRFLGDALPTAAEVNVANLAMQRSLNSSVDLDTAINLTQGDYDRAGTFLLSFDSATVPALRQMRTKIQLANLGSLNLEIDEIGNNLLENQDVLNAGLELYDMGEFKEKLIKNTQESVRSYNLTSQTPMNILMFGAPVALLDGASTEDRLRAMFETGYARRCLFAYEPEVVRQGASTPAELLKMMQQGNTPNIAKLSQQIGDLADPSNSHLEIEMPLSATHMYLQHMIDCESRVAEMCQESQSLQILELSHQYFKAIKVAGSLAFAKGEDEISDETMGAALQYVMDSGEDYARLLKSPPKYERVAQYLAAQTKRAPLTQSEMVAEMPYYAKENKQGKQEVLKLATSWGYRNGILIKTYTQDEIEFTHAKPLEKVDQDNMRISYGQDVAHDWHVKLSASWKDLPKVFMQPGMNWNPHAIHIDPSTGRAKPRHSDNLIPGVDMVALDVDGTATLGEVAMLLKEYEYYIYTTKSHQIMKDGEVRDRFRIIMPLTHRFDEVEEYNEFMENIFEWLPFDVDIATKDPARKWASHAGTLYHNAGKSLDSLMFMPRTTHCVKEKQRQVDLANLTKLERWFISQGDKGQGRNNQLHKYMTFLVDGGLDYASISARVKELNRKFSKPLEDTEIDRTVLISAQRLIQKRP